MRPSVRFFPRWNPNSGSQVAGLLHLACDIREADPNAGDWVEVGTHRGEAALILSSLSWVKRLRTVDHTLGDCIEEVHERLKCRCEVVQLRSTEFAATLADASIDVVYIDGDHAYESVAADIAAFWPKLRPGGFLAGHDYHDAYPGVAKAVGEFLKRNGDRVSWLRRYEDGSWLVRKRLKLEC